MDVAFKWNQFVGYTTIPPLATGERYGTATAMLRDASTVVGRLTNPAVGGGQAFLWTTGATVGLGWLGAGGPGVPDSTATSVNGTQGVGISVAGYSTGGRLAMSAFLYTAAAGMVEIPALPGAVESRAFGTSFYGDVVVGDCMFPDGHHEAFLWDRWLGTCSLRQLVLASGGVIPDGWTLDHAYGVNDQAIVVGAGHDAMGHEVAYTARPRRCIANCDLSTTPPTLDIADFACFLNRFAAGEEYANCDHSTTPPTLNVRDFICFINKFAAGCSVP
jgi:hypothetical protein